MIARVEGGKSVRAKSETHNHVNLRYRIRFEIFIVILRLIIPTTIIVYPRYDISIKP